MESSTLLGRVITSQALGCRGQIEARKEIGRGQAMPSADLIHKYALLMGSLSIQDRSHIFHKKRGHRK